MSRLPLFPLNTVLFPGAPLRLHIFEPRYRQMVRRCLDDQQDFGVTLIRQGMEALGPLAQPYMTGCSAEILHSQMLKDERINLLVMGKERFQIRSLDTLSESYLIGEVEPYPLQVRQAQGVGEAAARLRDWISYYLARLMQAGLGQYDLEHLPEDPAAVAWLAAALVQVDAREKQAWLEALGLDEVLVELLRVYRREVSLLKTMLLRTPGKEDMFSRN